jgi:2'-5' RNA ligase
MPAAGLHLTVAFLGELPCARLPWLAAVLARQGSRPPPVVLDRLETWGDGRWRCAVGTATPSLRAWQGRVAATLAAGEVGGGRAAR